LGDQFVGQAKHGRRLSAPADKCKNNLAPDSQCSRQ
jgi:hypothetical protein